jgi:uncharacterized membrane protein YedE/YeeE
MNMRQNLAAFVSGLVFAIGLVVGGMTDPAKVLAFLDVAGAWDPSLLFVMGGAILVYAPLYRVVTRRKIPWVGEFHLPTRRDVDSRLVAGATLFGLGWGLVGLCPGPALVGLASFGRAAWVCTGSMLAGMALFAAWERIRVARKGRKR